MIEIRKKLDLSNNKKIHESFKELLDKCSFEDAGNGMRNVYCGPIIGNCNNIIQYYPNGETMDIFILGIDNVSMPLNVFPTEFIESIYLYLCVYFETDNTIYLTNHGETTIMHEQHIKKRQRPENKQ